MPISNSNEKLKELVNSDLKHLVSWPNTNEISVNVKKSEIKKKNKNFMTPFYG